MAGPWEKYAQKTPESSEGPWTKYAPAQDQAPAEPTERPSQGLALESIRTAGNIGMGALKGASDIGATLLRPVDAVLNKIGVTDKTNEQRRADMKQFFSENADPESMAFKGGELATDIAGTAGVAGVLGKVAQSVGAAPKVVSALQSGGFRLGSPAAKTLSGKAADMGLRTAAGGVVGGVSAGAIDPESAGTGAMIGAALPPGIAAAGKLGSGLKSAGHHILGKMTGTSAETLQEAFKAGKAGSTDFLKNMRGEVPFDDIVDAAKQGLSDMRLERAKAYKSGMVNIKGDKTVLDMTPISKAVSDIQSSGNFKGKAINEKAAGTIKEIADKVDDWAKSKAQDFHTPEGLDALKQAIGDIRDSTQFGTPARRAADNVYNAIKAQIQKQAPKYAEVMKDYSEASKTLEEVTKALSLGEKASKDTAMRKLQSLMRNNAQTNYGNRLDLANTLQQKGNVELNPAIAGQALSSWMPRGLQGLVSGGAAPVMALTGNPVAAMAIAAGSSPRLMGEAMYGAGRVAGGSRNALAGMTRGALPAGQNQLSEVIMANPILRNALIQANAN